MSINSDRYWPQVLDLDENLMHAQVITQRRILYVKRKTGFLMFDHQDPKGLQGILSRPSFPKPQQQDTTKNDSGRKNNNSNNPQRSSERNKAEFLRSFSADPNILAFAQLNKYVYEAVKPAWTRYIDTFWKNTVKYE